MGTGYTRNDTANNISDGNVINAADFDGEYDAIEAAFNSSTGHTHDGSSSEGAPIEVVGPAQDVVITTTAIRPKTTNTVDLGTASLLYKDAFIDGTATLGGIIIDDAGTIGSASDTDAITISSGGVVTFSQTPLVDIESATTSSNINTLTLRAQSSGTPAVGIGTGMQFQVETAAGNVETGGSIRTITTGLTPTDEEIDLVFYSMRNGSLTEAFRFDSDLDALNITGNLSLGDNDKAIFGAGSDLQIYHNNTSGGSYIDENGFGDLNIRSVNGASIRLYSGGTASSNTSLIASSSGEIKLYYSGSQKLATTATGVDITGTLTVDKGSAGTLATFTDGVNSNFVIETASLITTVGNTGGSTALAFKSANTERMRIDNSGNVGIGTASPSAKLQVAGTTQFGAVGTDGVVQFLRSSDGGAVASVAFQSGTSEVKLNNAISGPMTFYTNNTERMRIDSSGNVGIGTSSPENFAGFTTQTINGGTGSVLAMQAGGVGNTARFVKSASIFSMEAVAAIPILFTTNNTERMRIDSSGNVGIGTDSPNSKLTLSTGDKIFVPTGEALNFGHTDGSTNTERMRIASTGELLVGTTSDTMPAAAAAGQAIMAGTRTFIATETGGDTILGGTTGSNYTAIYQGGTERMRIDSSGNVGIGTTSPTNFSNSSVLEVAGGVGTGAVLASSNSGTVIAEIQGNNSDGLTYFGSRTNHPVVFRQNGFEKMRIDTSGNVGIGTDSFTRRLNVVDATSDGSGGILIQNYLPTLELDDASGGGTSTIIKHDGTNTIIENGGSEAMRIDSSGNLLVGKTSANTSTVGVEALANGEMNATVNGGRVISLDRLGSDGDIIRLRKSSTTVGSIASENGYTKIVSGNGTAGSGLGFYNYKVSPVNPNGNVSDNAVDLGDSDQRFKDLYLSGGVYLGGTGAANYLEDYEEGTFIYTLNCSTSGSYTPRTGYTTGFYTKVGRIVTINLRYESLGSSSPSGAIQLGNLPFVFISSITDGSPSFGAPILLRGANNNGDFSSAFLAFAPGDSHATFYKQLENGTYASVSNNDVASAIEGYASFTYVTSA
jgi:hypothetical protein